MASLSLYTSATTAVTSLPSPARRPATRVLIRCTGRPGFQATLSSPTSYPAAISVTASAISLSPRASPPHKYVYPDPIPEFAESETDKFKTELRRRLSRESETFGDDLDEVLEVCTQIFREFLHKDYGGPGTLLVEPFTDMMVALKDRNLPGAAFAARTSLLWAQNYVDLDWEIWNSKLPN